MSHPTATIPLPALPALPALGPDNPWPGLDSFREPDSAYFRGRRREISALLDLVVLAPLTVLYGRSGLGKSSLIQAGVFPRLRERHLLPVYIRLRHAVDSPTPSEQILTALQAAASVPDVEAPPLHDGDSLWAHLHRADGVYWGPDNRPITPVFVLDQFEEAFTHGQQDAVRGRTTAFFRELADVVEGRLPADLAARFDVGEARPQDYATTQHRYKVVLSMREDFLAELDELQSSMPSVVSAANRMRLLPMRGDVGVEVTQAGGPTLVPPAVGESIVRLVAQAHDGKPLRDFFVDPAILSFVLLRLNERRHRDNRPALGSDWGESERDKILEEFYEQSVGVLGLAVCRFVEDKLLTRNGHRDSMAVDRALGEPGITEEVIDALVLSRFVRREDVGSLQRIELTHDVLTGVVRRRREARQVREGAERARLEDEERRRTETAERERQTAELKRASRRLMVMGLALAFSALMTVVAAASVVQRDGAMKELERLKDSLQLSLDTAQTTINTIEEADATSGRTVGTSDPSNTPNPATKPDPSTPPPAVAIQYFRKSADPQALAESLTALKDADARAYKVDVRRTLNDRLETNYIAYGSRVPFGDVRRVALAAMSAGASLRAICRLGTDRGVGGADRSFIIQVIGAASVANYRVLTAGDVRQGSAALCR